jgi:site-specific DNA-cytosine methylase
MMKILVACEYSGTVRDAFIAQGYDAISCDLLPTDAPGPHYQGDVCDILNDGFDLMIAHPPCTHLAVSGARWFKDKQKEQAEALDFVRLLLNAPIDKIALENPISIISSRIRKPNQIIQPWQFGHPESKSTCLWLKNLPTLVPTNILSLPESGRWNNQTPSGQNKLGPSEDRWKIRSATYKGIAQAMAEQWGKA